MRSRGSSSSQSSSLTPRVSQIHLNYDRVEEQLKAKQDELAVEREASRAMRNSLAAYNAQMQVFMAVRKKNNFIAFLTFSGM
jgi:hypothetical protein